MAPRSGDPRKASSGDRNQPAKARRTPVPPTDGSVRVGRRPSPPAFLALVSVLWIVAGIFILVKGTASWKLIAGIACIGIGLLYLRGAAATVLRRNR